MPKGDPAGYLPRVQQKRKRMGIDPKYRNSKFNPFAHGGVSAGQRIKRGSSNAPAEDDSDFDPRRHGNRKSSYRTRKARGRR